MATLKDVSRLAGVSESTVSRVLNGTGRIGEKTRERVQKAILEANYRPNRAAKALATRSSGIIGFISTPSQNTFYGSLVNALAESILVHSNRRMMFEYGGKDADSIKAAVQRLVSEQCDGIIIYSRSIEESFANELCQSTDIPIVFLNRFFPSLRANCVTIDNRVTSYQAVRYLIEKGHQNIACIAGESSYESGRERYEGYVQAMEEAGLTIDPSLVCQGQYSAENGWSAIDQFHGKAFTAIFACSFGQASGAMQHLQKLGYTLPDDVSIICFDTVMEGVFMQPMLSFVDGQVERIGKLAMERTIELAEGADPEGLDTHLLTGKLVVNDSVKQVCHHAML